MSDNRFEINDCSPSIHLARGTSVEGVVRITSRPFSFIVFVGWGWGVGGGERRQESMYVWGLFWGFFLMNVFVNVCMYMCSVHVCQWEIVCVYVCVFVCVYMEKCLCMRVRMYLLGNQSVFI